MQKERKGCINDLGLKKYIQEEKIYAKLPCSSWLLLFRHSDNKKTFYIRPKGIIFSQLTLNFWQHQIRNQFVVFYHCKSNKGERKKRKKKKASCLYTLFCLLKFHITHMCNCALSLKHVTLSHSLIYAKCT